ncbi:MAG: hypothetical protein KF870_05740 [Leadbetterella sp.]|nr:hypothetical protein [Leadbetterella sp.]
MKRKLITSMFLFLAGAVSGQVKQETDHLKRAGIKVNGMAGANFTSYNTTGLENRSIPFNTLFTGSLTMDLFGKVKMPVAFSLSNQNINFSHPFDRNYRFAQPLNRLIMRPTYKGLTLHLGTASMNFSPYTLAGHRFDGVGVEYKPAKMPFYVAAMTGNLMRAVRVDVHNTVRNNMPSYKRTGWGVMAGYRKKQDKAEIIFFTAKDKLHSLPYNLDSLGIPPMENSVVSLKLEKGLFNFLTIGGETAWSGITTDLRADDRPGSRKPTFLGTLTPKTTTQYLGAYKGFINYNGKTFNLGAEYTRVPPGYRTLGAYFFTNDLETFSGRYSSVFMQGKVTLSANLGMQRDNVDKQKLKTLNRWVGSANLVLVPHENINVNLSYSNFTSFSNTQSNFAYLAQATPYNYLDTLAFRQINSNLQTALSWRIPSDNENLSRSLSVMGLFQRGQDQNGNQKAANNMTNASLDYTLELQKQKMSLSTALFYSDSYFAGMPDRQFGPSLVLTKTFGKVNNQLNTMYTLGRMPEVKESIINLRYGLIYTLPDNHRIRFDAVVLDRKARSTTRMIPDFTEYTFTLGYVYNFNVLNKSLKVNR